MKKGYLLFLCFTLAGAASGVTTQEVKSVTSSPDEKAEAPKPKYVGVSKCMTCHKMESRGDQYTKWFNSRHAKAYATLASEKALEFAKARGVKDPQKSEKCLKCHVTAYGADTTVVGEKFKIEDGVQCETCHGPGEFYSKASIKTPKKWEEDPEGMHKKALAAGLIVPTKESCIECHNKESPGYKEFDFEKFLAQIAHPRPKKEKAKTGE